MKQLFSILSLAIVGVVAAFVVLTLTASDPPTVEAAFEDTDGDGAIDLGEELVGSDPNDPNSTPESTVEQFLTGEPLCFDELDNDLDGLVDGDDSSCVDSDEDLISDYSETNAGSDPNDFGSFPEDARFDAILGFYDFPVFTCSDGRDNDDDGLIDGEEAACEQMDADDDGFVDALEKRFGSDPQDAASTPEHRGPNPGSCGDGIDNDQNGLTDDADPNCGSPANDDRANATVISGLPYADGPVIVKNASVEPDEPRPDCGFGRPVSTIWYQYTATEDAVLVAGAGGGPSETIVAVWEEGEAELEEIDCSFGYNATGSSTLAFQASAGATYYFQLDGYFFGSALPQFTFNLEVGTPPPNDSFIDRVEIGALPFADTVDTTAALTQFGEPSCYYDDLRSTVWYAYTAAEDALLVADASDTDIYTIVGVWTDSKFGLVEVGCAQGYPPTPAKLAVHAEAGRTYYFQVGGRPYGTSSGELTFNLEIGVPPANDNFADATPISALPFKDSVETLTASLQPGEPNPGCLAYDEIAATVWYTYTAPTDDMLSVDMGDSGRYATGIGVYQGSSLGELALHACADPYEYSPLFLFEVSAGETYHMQVGQLSFARPLDTEIQVDTFEIPSCPAPEFSVTDPLGDTFGFSPPPGISPPQHDIVSVSGASDAENFCLTAEFAEPIEPPDSESLARLRAWVDFDLDQNADTGYRGETNYHCRQAAPLGVETQLYLRGGPLIPIYGFFIVEDVPPPTVMAAGGFVPETSYAIVLFEEKSFTLIVPMEALGGDDSFNFGLVTIADWWGATDCAPNSGTLSPTGLRDSDGDGCVDALEEGDDATLGGARDPDNFWDFYDVPTGSPAERDGQVAITDVGAVVARFGTSSPSPPSEGEALAEAFSTPADMTSYHAAYDRGGSKQGGDAWDLLPPDGDINITDVGAVVAQFGHSCM